MRVLSFILLAPFAIALELLDVIRWAVNGLALLAIWVLGFAWSCLDEWA